MVLIMSEKICPICNSSFIPKTWNNKYCSSDCAYKAQNEKTKQWIKNKYKNDEDFRKKMLATTAKNQHNNTEKVNEYQRKWKENNKDKILKYKQNEYVKLYNRKRKWAVLYYYSNGTMKCACCGENKYEFLTIEHKENNPDTRTIKQRRSERIENWLLKNDLPDGFEVLCYNCNCSKGFHGFCPHKHPEKCFGPPKGYIYTIEKKTTLKNTNIKRVNQVYSIKKKKC
jgi:hypothetical protein